MTDTLHNNVYYQREGGRTHFIFLMHTLKMETKIKRLAHLVGVPVPS